MKEFLELIEDFIRTHFDKIILVYVLHVLIFNERWDMANMALGAIITLMTGKVIDRYKNGNGGNGNALSTRPVNSLGDHQESQKGGTPEAGTPGTP